MQEAEAEVHGADWTVGRTIPPSPCGPSDDERTDGDELAAWTEESSPLMIASYNSSEGSYKEERLQLMGLLDHTSFADNTVMPAEDYTPPVDTHSQWRKSYTHMAWGILLEETSELELWRTVFQLVPLGPGKCSQLVGPGLAGEKGGVGP